MPRHLACIYIGNYYTSLEAALLSISLSMLAETKCIIILTTIIMIIIYFTI